MNKFRSIASGAAIASMALLAAGSAQAQIINDLYNTSVDGSGNKITTVGLIDLHYTDVTTPTVDPGAPTSVLTTYYGAWYSDGVANYITPDQNFGQTFEGGVFARDYRTTFTLPNNVDLTSVSIAGGWAVDNSGLDVLINGFSTGATAASYGSLFAFALPGGHFLTGTNTLDFKWSNGGGPGGMLVEFNTMSYKTLEGPGGTPEPGSLALFGSLAVTGGTLLRRRRK